jgi:hypothetical protein
VCVCVRACVRPACVRAAEERCLGVWLAHVCPAGPVCLALPGGIRPPCRGLLPAAVTAAIYAVAAGVAAAGRDSRAERAEEATAAGR